MTHFLQSKQWAQFQESLGRKVFFDAGPGWSYTAILEKGRFNTRLYCPYGPQIDKKAALAPALASLQKLGRTHHVTFVRIEPVGDVSSKQLTMQHFKKVSYLQLQPEHTLLIDLTPSEEDIVAQMAPNVRNLYRNYAKKGISLHESSRPEDIVIFTQFMHKVARRNDISTHSDEYFKKQAKILLANGSGKIFYALLDNKTPVAAAFVYDSDDTRYYAHSAADDDYRKLRVGTSLLAHLIIDAKKAGLKTFDLYGIAPTDDPKHPWAGFTVFKKSFGGSPLTYLGAWDFALKPLKYRLYRLYQTLSR
jgi:lipid II:glycine glycyltransferase (peptidoglycan interpeptide bridge formation enzyme)